MNIVVTGSNGYIGQCLMSRATVHQWDCVGVDLDLFRSSRLKGSYSAPIQSDFRLVPRKVLSRADVVVHLAAISNDPMAELDERITAAVNYRGTVQLARDCSSAGVGKFIFMSTCSVYGSVADGSEGYEDGPVNPLTAYARSKFAAECALGRMDTDMQVIILRGATAFGASRNPRLDLVVNDFTWSALVRDEVLLQSDGRANRPLVAADDIAAVITEFIAGSTSVPRVTTLNVGSRSETYPIVEVARIVASQTGVTVRLAHGAEPDVRTYLVNFDRLANYLPSTFSFTTLANGIAELADMIGQNAEAFQVRDSFIRLAQLRNQPMFGGLSV